jgi:hypothetical protein
MGSVPRRLGPILLVALLAAPAARGATLVPALVFAGEGGGLPPDTMGAVGPAHVVEITNGGFAVHDRGGGVLLSQSLGSFWTDAGLAVDDTYDPRIAYDPSSDRWFVVSLNGRYSNNQILLAVSNDADPTHGFAGFSIDSDSADQTWADFPTLGFDAETVTIASDMIPNGPDGLPVAVDVLVVPKADLVGSMPSIARATLFERAQLSVTGFAPQPVTALDGTGLPGWLLSSGVAFLGIVQSTRMGGDPLAPTLAAGPFVHVTPHPTPPEAARLNGGLLDTGDGHFASPVRIGGSLWAVRGAQGSSGRAAIHWLELDPDTLAVRQDGTIEDPGRDFLYPSIAADPEGLVVIGFSASSTALAASAFAVLGETTGGTTRFGAPIELLQGAAGGPRTGVARFGDYSATVLDPVAPRRFWTFQETEGEAIAIAALDVVPEPESAAGDVGAALALVAIAGRARCGASLRRRTLARLAAAAGRRDGRRS